MKILLTAVNAKYIHSNLAVYSLRASAGPYRPLVELKEYTINQQPDEVLGDIYRSHPDFVCFSCYIWNISYIRDLCTELKKILPEVRIWLGGPEVSYNAGEVLEKLPQAEGVFLGEGEITFREWLDHLAGGNGALSEIPGITFRAADGRIKEGKFREPADLSKIPFVYEDLQQFDHRIIYYESSRGCPFSCSYCLSSIDKKLRFRDLELVKRELSFFLERKVPQVKFVDRTFNCSHSRTKEIWEFLLEHDNGITNFHFEISADLLDEEELALLGRMRPGQVQLEIGVQTTNERTLSEICRKTDFARLSVAVRKIQKGHNVHQHLDLIAGLPWEDYDSFGKSFNDVYELKPEQLQLGFLKVLKGSGMHSRAEAYGCLFRSREPYEVLATRWLSYGELLRLKQIEEMVEVYYNSGQFAGMLPELEKMFPDAFSMYEALGQFYEEKGYFGLAHTRIRRYEILLEFVRERKGEERLFEELALLSLYQRENLKSRPSFAPDQTKEKEKIRIFYKERARKYLPGYEDYDFRQMSRMTHLEHFSRILPGGEGWVLFDYQRRDPLNYSARMVVLKEEDLTGNGR